MDGKPVKPQLKTLDVNLVGAMYSECYFHPKYPPHLKFLRHLLAPATHLALHYLPKSPHPTEPLRYVVLLGFLGGLSLVIIFPDDDHVSQKPHGMHTLIKRSSLPLSMDYSDLQDQHNRFSSLTGFA